jgi:hypothetical protein
MMWDLNTEEYDLYVQISCRRSILNAGPATSTWAFIAPPVKKINPCVNCHQHSLAQLRTDIAHVIIQYTTVSRRPVAELL